MGTISDSVIHRQLRELSNPRTRLDVEMIKGMFPKNGEVIAACGHVSPKSRLIKRTKFKTTISLYHTKLGIRVV